MNRYITLDENNIIISIRCGNERVGNEIESDLGEIGQKLLEDGTFVDIEQEETKEEISMEDKINYIYYKLQGGII